MLSARATDDEGPALTHTEGLVRKFEPSSLVLLGYSSGTGICGSIGHFTLDHGGQTWTTSHGGGNDGILAVDGREMMGTRRGEDYVNTIGNNSDGLKLAVEDDVSTQ